jgi:hypothetical protein
MENLQTCTKLSDLLKAQKKIIKRHIREHKWFKQISDENIGIVDFINQYGWLMREMYCDNICCNKENCEVYKRILEKYPNEEKP